MAILFDEILSKGIRAGQIPAREQSAREWYRNTAQNYNKMPGVKSTRRVNENSLLRQTDRLTSRPKIGEMYMFGYDAKHKATLPYFDKFPLIFPFASVKGGFMGINLHYLPLVYRAKLMDALYGTRTNSKYDETTRLRINYDILNGASKYRYFQPCVKHYLNDHVKSQFVYVYPSEWDVALFLPLERFSGASKTKVWSDSRKAIGS
jgi:hypothetical protein